MGHLVALNAGVFSTFSSRILLPGLGLCVHNRGFKSSPKPIIVWVLVNTVMKFQFSLLVGEGGILIVYSLSQQAHLHVHRIAFSV